MIYVLCVDKDCNFILKISIILMIYVLCVDMVDKDPVLFTGIMSLMVLFWGMIPNRQ